MEVQSDGSSQEVGRLNGDVVQAYKVSLSSKLCCSVGQHGDYD